MNIIQITASCVCICVVALTLKNTRSEMAIIITLAAVVFVTAGMVPYIIDIISSMEQFSSYSSLGRSYLVPVLKITGIAYISQMGKELCEDAGEMALAGRVEAAGKLSIAVISLPIAGEAFEKIMEIMG